MTHNRQAICEYMQQFGFTLSMQNGGDTWFVFTHRELIGIMMQVTVEDNAFMYQAEACLANIVTAKTIASTNPITVLQQACVLRDLIRLSSDFASILAIPSKEDAILEWVDNVNIN